MLSFEELWELLSLYRFRSKAQSLSESLIESMTKSCNPTEVDSCRDDSAALHLKFVAIALILIAGISGVAIPLIGKHRRFIRTEGCLFVVAKAFAAGVILATGFVHMLSGGSEALSNPCLPEYPWSKFPFSGFFAMMASLLTLLVDFVGTHYYETRKGVNQASEERARVGLTDTDHESDIVPVLEGKDINEHSAMVFGEEKGGGMHVVGMHAHAAHHGHSHRYGQDACDGHVKEYGGRHSHGHGHRYGDGFGDGDEENGARHVVVSQVLELGIVSHSVIIGLSLGVSESPCTIKPLVVALSFHQFFEGFALGGCISQAKFNTLSATLMASFFAITTPAGIGIGIAIASFYNPHSPGALIAEGVLDSLSAGILVYMALVDLVAADFLSKRMSCNFRLQVGSYFMLFLGAGTMASLAIWA